MNSLGKQIDDPIPFEYLCEGKYTWKIRIALHINLTYIVTTFRELPIKLYS
jgi:hypothetical protein